MRAGRGTKKGRPRGLLLGLVLLAGLLLTVVLVTQGDEEFGCADVGVTARASASEPDRALELFLREHGGDPAQWKRAHDSQDWVQFEPRGAEKLNGFRSITVRRQRADTWRVAGGCV
jgi:hypothetical protein